MKKKILIVLIVIVVAGLVYLNTRDRTLSPPGSVELVNGNLKVSVQYSRPSVRNRIVFGTKEQDALQPYGEYWRLGANEATEITFSKPVSFNGNKVDAGTYRVYAIPGAETFELILNSELGVWGVFEPDEDEDILRTKVQIERLSSLVEQFTINLQATGDTTNIHFEWEMVRFSVPVVPN